MLFSEARLLYKQGAPDGAAGSAPTQTAAPPEPTKEELQAKRTKADIIGEHTDLTKKAHRASRVERARLRARIERSTLVFRVAGEVVDETIASVEQQESVAKQALEKTDLTDREREEIQSNLTELAQEKESYRKIKLGIVQDHRAEEANNRKIGTKILKTNEAAFDFVIGNIAPKTKGWSRGAKMRTTVAAIGIPLVLYGMYKVTTGAVSAAWRYSPIRWMLKRAGFIEGDEDLAGTPGGNAPAPAPAARRGSAMPWILGGTAIAGVLAFFGIKKYKEMTGKIDELKNKASDVADSTRERAGELRDNVRNRLTGNEASPDTPEDGPDLSDENKEVAKEASESVGAKGAASAFLLEHRKSIDKFNDLEKQALEALIQSPAISGMAPDKLITAMQDFEFELTIEQLLKDSGYSPNPTNDEVQVMVVVAALLANQSNNNEYQTVGDFLHDSTIGRAFGGAIDLISEKGLANISPREFAASMLNAGHAFIKQERSQNALGEAGVEQGDRKRFVAHCFANGNENLNAYCAQDTEFKEQLASMRDYIQTNQAYLKLPLHGKPYFETIASYVGENADSPSKLTVLDALELYMFLQLSGLVGTPIEEARLADADGKAALMLQMKVLDLLSKTPEGEKQAIDIKTLLMVKASDPDLDIPPEVRNALVDIAKFAANTGVNWFLDMADKVWTTGSSLVANEFEEHPVRATAITAAGVTYSASYIRNTRIYHRMLAVRNVHTLQQAQRMGYLTEDSYRAAQSAAEQFHRYRGRFWHPNAPLKRFPIISHFVASHFDKMDRYIKLSGYSQLSADDIFNGLRQSHKGLTPKGAEYIRTIANRAMPSDPLSFARGGGRVSMVEKFKTFMQQGGRVRHDKVKNAWQCVNALVDGKMPTQKALQAAGMTADEIAQMATHFGSASTPRTTTTPRTNTSNSGDTSRNRGGNRGGTDVVDDLDDVGRNRPRPGTTTEPPTNPRTSTQPRNSSWANTDPELRYLDEVDEVVRGGSNVDETVRIATNADTVIESGRLTRLGLPPESTNIQTLVRQRNNLAVLEQVFETSGEQGVRRGVVFLTEVNGHANNIICDERVVLKVAEGVDDPRAIARLFVESGEGLTSADDAVRCLDDIAKLHKSGLGRLLGGAALLAEGVMLGLDIWMLIEAKEEMKKTVDNVIAQLDAMVEAGYLTKSGDTYKGQGVEISLTDVENMHATEVEKHWGYAATSTASLGATAVMLTTGAAFGPGGLILAGTVIAVRVGIDQVGESIDQAKRQKFLYEAAPTWLLAMMRTSTLVGHDEEDLMKENTGFMRSDILPHSWWEPNFIVNRTIENLSGHRTKVKQAIREKLLQSLAYSETADRFGDLLAELPNSDKVQQMLDPEGEFLRDGGDYDRFVRRAAVISLHANYDREPMQAMNLAEQWAQKTEFSFENTETLDISIKDGSWMTRQVDYIHEGDLDRAAMTGMLWYVHHRRHRWYLDKRAHLKEKFGDDPAFEKLMVDQLDEKVRLESHRFYVFNKHPNEFPLTKKTAPEMLLDRAYEAVSNASDAESAQVANRRLPGVEPNQVTGIDNIYRKYLAPDFRASDYAALRRYSDRHTDMPHTFEELEQWGEDDEFSEKFIALMGPLHGVKNALKNAQSVYEMQMVFTRRADVVDTYFTYSRYNWFYCKYCERRGFGTGLVPEKPNSMMKLMYDWHKEGQPELISGEFLSEVFEDPTWQTPKKKEQPAFATPMYENAIVADDQVVDVIMQLQSNNQSLYAGSGRYSPTTFSWERQRSETDEFLEELKIKALPRIHGYDPKKHMLSTIDIPHVDIDNWQDAFAQTQLYSQTPTRRTDLDQFGIVDSRSNTDFGFQSNRSLTPTAGSRFDAYPTPVYGSRTPTYGSTTPLYGNTPTYVPPTTPIYADSSYYNNVIPSARLPQPAFGQPIYQATEPEKTTPELDEILTADGIVKLSTFKPSFNAFAIHNSRVNDFLENIRKGDKFDKLRMHFLRKQVLVIT